MKNIDFLLEGDPSVRRLTQKYLLDQETTYTDQGWIHDFLSCFDSEQGTWGNGIYGPKWISTFYTLRDLMSLEIDPKHPIYQEGLQTLIAHMWNPDEFMEDDVCVVAMLVSLLTYGRYDPSPIAEMMQYLIRKQLPDGGWNCVSAYRTALHSSIHTTLSVLEAYRDYEREGYREELERVREQAKEGQEYLLRKRLLRRESDGELIVPYITQFHFPTRWKYDVLRALVYFTSIQYPYDPRMEEALELLREKIKKAYLTKGTTYSGRLHFSMETSRIGRMNTLRGLQVLKYYDPDYYNKLIGMDIFV